MSKGKARRKGSILKEIMAHKRLQLPDVMRTRPVAELEALASFAAPPKSLLEALRPAGVSLIAECKRASPSRGLIARHYDPAHLATEYRRGGASAVSVLTDEKYFQGSLDHLRAVSKAMSGPRGLPILRKDFIFHRYQILEAREAGADAVLLIAAILSLTELKDLLEVARELGMNCLVETHDEAELEKAVQAGARIIGINNRDLKSFKVDLSTTERLLKLVPQGIVTVSESGARGPSDVRLLAAQGVDAVLVGEALVRSPAVHSLTRAMVKAGKSSS